MNWFNNLGITYKLTFSYIVMASLVIWVGLLGLNDIQILNDNNEEMYKKHLSGLKYLTHIAEAYPTTLSMTKDIFLSDDPGTREKYRQEILKSENMIDEWNHELEATVLDEEEKRLYQSYIQSNGSFKEERDRTIQLLLEGSEKEKQLRQLNSVVQNRADKLKREIDKLIEFKERSADAARQSNLKRVEEARSWLTNFVVSSILLTIIVAVFVYYSISKPIMTLKDRASQVAIGDLQATIDIKRKDEIGLVIRSFNDIVENLSKMVDQADAIATGDYNTRIEARSNKDKLAHSLIEMNTSLRDQNWLKDSLRRLNKMLSGHFTLKEIAERTIALLGRELDAGSGTLYIYMPKTGALKLFSSYAYIERDKLFTEFRLGEGVVGQVAFEGKPILLKNITDKDSIIATGTVHRPPLNTYTFPLMYEQEICGVIELASFEVFTPLKQRFIDEASEVIASHIYSANQSEQIKKLLKTAEEARIEAQTKAEEVEKANLVLTEQQAQLQQQAEELQQQTEEMQQQAEELQQTNDILQQQQHELEDQRKVLEAKNDELVTAQMEIQNRADELDKASKYKSEFLANMSHELRTPLNSIILLSDMLRRSGKNLTEKEKQKASIIYQSGNDLLNLINDILDISKIEAGKMVVNIHHFHSSEIVNEISGLFDEMARQKGLEFKVKDDWNAEMINDKDKIKQVLKNFISNAIKFTKKGVVTLSISQTGNEKLPLRLSVRDTGIGIPKDKQKIIFEAFQQADGSVSREFGGTGLGLSIAREMTRLLGGEVHLYSEAGKGSEFYILLPIKNIPSGTESESQNVEFLYQPKEKDSFIKKSEETIRKAIPSSYGSTVQTLKVEDDRSNIVKGDRIILVVEDNIDYANSLAEISKSIGFKAIIATTGREALELTRKYEPIGVLLDLGLPDISGEDVLVELKSTLELRHVPISIVSARDQNRKLLEKGAVNYLQKPVEAGQIRDSIFHLAHISGKQPKHMLIVEDNAVQREIIMDLISKEGVKVKGVTSESEALKELKSGNYDSITVDLGLKDGNGMSLCRNVNKLFPNLPVIVYTGKVLSQEDINELKLYSVSVIIKDADSHSMLLEKMRLFLHKVYKGDDQVETDDIFEAVHNLKGKIEDAETTVEHIEEVETAPVTDQQEFSDETEELFAGQVVNAALEAILAKEDTVDGEETFSLTNKKVLIVDDDIRNVFVLTSALENLNADTLEAFNGKEAIDILEEEGSGIDLILMDIMMPVMDGYEAMKAIRAQEKWKSIPIIAVTAKALREDRQKCLDAGADEYMTKPIDYKVLTTLLKQFLAKKR